jgi:DNA mismatch repair protein MLH3
MPDPNTNGPHWHDCDISHKTSGYGSAASLLHSFHKNDLRRARIISQVDRKFIACLFERQLDKEDELCGLGDDRSSSKGHALVLIDQHAADERVRVECFLKELCLGFLHNQNKIKHSAGGVQVRELSPLFPVLLTLHEAQQLKRSRIQAAFRTWGFHFEDLSDSRFCDSDADSDSNPLYTQVLVQGVPDVVGDKVCPQSGDIRVKLIIFVSYCLGRNSKIWSKVSSDN